MTKKFCPRKVQYAGLRGLVDPTIVTYYAWYKNTLYVCRSTRRVWEVWGGYSARTWENFKKYERAFDVTTADLPSEFPRWAMTESMP